MRYDPQPRSSLRSGWAAVAAGVLVAGVAGSLFMAQAVAHNRTDDARHAFESSAADAEARLRLALQRQQDLAVGTAAQIAAHPSQMAATLDAWVTNGQVFARYPEVQGLGALISVTNAVLPTLAATMPPGFAVLPPGPRPMYCLALAGLGRPDFAEGLVHNLP